MATIKVIREIHMGTLDKATIVVEGDTAAKVFQDLETLEKKIIAQIDAQY